MKFVTKHWVENPKAPVDWKLLSSKLLDKTPRRCHERYMLRCAMYPTVRLGPFSSTEVRVSVPLLATVTYPDDDDPGRCYLRPFECVH